MILPDQEEARAGILSFDQILPLKKSLKITFECNTCKCNTLRTIATHANCNALLMATVLTSISASFVDDTISTFRTSIIDFVDL